MEIQLRGQHNGDYKQIAEIPDHVIESLARCILPSIREYYDSEEG